MKSNNICDPGKYIDVQTWSSGQALLIDICSNFMLTKLSNGLYYCPKKTAFGEVPAEDKKLVEAFLKDRRFLLHSPNAYNALGVGTLCSFIMKTIVYNHKRHGRFELGGRFFDFRVKPHFPKSLSEEFLLVDLVNNLDQVAEDRDTLIERVKRKALSMNRKAFAKAVRHYGSVRARKNSFPEVTGILYP